MTPDDLYDRFRSDVFDTAQPFLWSDTELYQYMDAAQKKFCNLAWGIPDSTSAITQITCPVTGNPAADAWVPIDPRVLRIRRVQRLSDYQKVTVINDEDLDVLMGGCDYGQLRNFTLDLTTGPIEYVITNMEQDKLRLLPIPAVADTLAMTIFRQAADLTDSTTAFEIHSDHHEYLLLWMKHLAYSKQDTETADPKKAQDYETQFTAYCAQARRQREAREHKPRAAAYGGI